jgi:hypothetical protein
MLYDLRIYDFRPGDLARYVAVFGSDGLPLITRHLPLVGYFTAETGTLNRAFHLWAYTDLEDRAARRRRLYEDGEWTKGFVPQGMPLIDRQANILLTPTTPEDNRMGPADAGTPRLFALLQSPPRAPAARPAGTLWQGRAITGPVGRLFTLVAVAADCLNDIGPALAMDGADEADLLVPAPFSPTR